MRRAFFVLALLSCGAQRGHCEDFHGRSCSDNCPELRAGYQWAQDQNAHDPYLCTGHTTGFDQGCGAYVEEAGSAPPPPPQQGGSDSQDDDRRDDESGDHSR
jgi:hypothetical protein